MTLMHQGGSVAVAIVPRALLMIYVYIYDWFLGLSRKKYVTVTSVGPAQDSPRRGGHPPVVSDTLATFANGSC